MTSITICFLEVKLKGFERIAQNGEGIQGENDLNDIISGFPMEKREFGQEKKRGAVFGKWQRTGLFLTDHIEQAMDAAVDAIELRFNREYLVACPLERFFVIGV